jgi:hypothetical protein
VASWSKSSRAPPLRSTEVAGFTLRGDACQRFPSDRYHQPRSMHYWRMESPMLPDRLPGNRQYCLDKAVECNRKAAQARDPNAAKEFHPSPHAGAWAATRDFNHKVEDILRTFGRPHHHDGLGHEAPRVHHWIAQPPSWPPWHPGQLVRHIGALPRQSRVVAPEPPFTRASDSITSPRSAVVEAIPIPASSRTAWSVRRNCHTPECMLRPAASGCLS